VSGNAEKLTSLSEGLLANTKNITGLNVNDFGHR